jgi:hypothetical protein
VVSVEEATTIMDSIITFPPPEPDLRLARPSADKWAATLAEERMRFQEDQEALRMREENLREYEARLRLLQAEIEAGRASASPHHVAAPTRSSSPFFQRPSRTPFNEDPNLSTAWEKLHRAREILEAEQKNLRDDRISIRELEIMVKQRAEEVAEREARLAEREALVTAATPAPVATREETPSAVTRFTRAPFEMARSVFGGKKAG